MLRRWSKTQLITAAFLAIPSAGFAQAQPSGTLAVSGYSGQVPVIKVDGKTYVEVDALARLTNGSVGYPADQMTLTLTAPAALPAQEKKGFSPDFLRAGIETMGAVREWRAALQHAVQNNYAVTEDWLGNFRRAVEDRRALTGVAATTDDDRSGLLLLDKEIALMQKLNDNYVSLYKSATYVTADSFERNPLNQQVLDCARGLAAAAGSGRYQDVSVCY